MKLIKVLQTMELAKIMTSKCGYKYSQTKDVRYKEFHDKFQNMKLKFEEIELDSDKITGLVNQVSDLLIDYKIFDNKIHGILY